MFSTLALGGTSVAAYLAGVDPVQEARAEWQAAQQDLPYSGSFVATPEPSQKSASTADPTSAVEEEEPEAGMEQLVAEVEEQPVEDADQPVHDAGVVHAQSADRYPADRPWLLPLMRAEDQDDDDDDDDDNRQHEDEFEAAMLEWAKQGSDVAGAIVDTLRQFQREDMLLVPELFRAIAPANPCGRSPPPWFPGTQAQYVTAMRMRAKGGSCRCAALSALVAYWRRIVASPESSTSMVEHLEASEEAIKHHVTEEIAPLKSLMLPHQGESAKDAIKRCQLQLSALQCFAAADRKSQQEAAREAKEARVKAAQEAKEAKAKAAQEAKAAQPSKRRRMS